jgi:hypothetical protein
MYKKLPTLVLALSLGCSSCWFSKPKPRIFIPPPAKARPPIPRNQPELPEPGIELKITAELPPLPEGEIPALPPPPAPKRVPAPPPPRQVAPPVPPPSAEVPPAPPQIGRIFTDDQAKEYKRNLDESTDRVKRTLAAVKGKRLNPELADNVRKIQSFLRQAEQTQDLATAADLAKKADLLAQDLIRRLQ